MFLFSSDSWGCQTLPGVLDLHFTCTLSLWPGVIYTNLPDKVRFSTEVIAGSVKPWTCTLTWCPWPTFHMHIDLVSLTQIYTIKCVSLQQWYLGVSNLGHALWPGVLDLHFTFHFYANLHNKMCFSAAVIAWRHCQTFIEIGWDTFWACTVTWWPWPIFHAPVTVIIL